MDIRSCDVGERSGTATAQPISRGKSMSGAESI